MNLVKNALIIIGVLLIIPLAAESREYNPGDSDKEDLTPLIPGTDKPRLHQCGDDILYRYNEYTIYTISSKQIAGDSVYVYKTDKTLRDICKIKEQEPLYTYDNEIMGGANFFAGLYLNHIFIDQGTGPTFRGLSIYDLKDNKLVFFTNYTDPVLSDSTLTYYESVHPREFFNAKNSCIHVGTWSKQGLSTYYQRQATYNLETGKKQSLDKYRCIPGQ